VGLAVSPNCERSEFDISPSGSYNQRVNQHRNQDRTMKTRNSFYRAFRKIAKQFTWHVHADIIYGKCKETKKAFSVLAAVYYVRSGRRIPFDRPYIAGQLLGLPPLEFQLIDTASMEVPKDKRTKSAREVLLRAIK
jgi:hypothetical protein